MADSQEKIELDKHLELRNEIAQKLQLPRSSGSSDYIAFMLYATKYNIQQLQEILLSLR